LLEEFDIVNTDVISTALVSYYHLKIIGNLFSKVANLVKGIMPQPSFALSY